MYVLVLSLNEPSDAFLMLSPILVLTSILHWLTGLSASTCLLLTFGMIATWLVFALRGLERTLRDILSV
jgi:uncharacterized membrane protein YecN with MAPEG domain